MRVGRSVSISLGHQESLSGSICMLQVLEIRCLQPIIGVNRAIHIMVPS
jgi:hypothetical protein